jgi:hypothetical protein
MSGRKNKNVPKKSAGQELSVAELEQQLAAARQRDAEAAREREREAQAREAAAARERAAQAAREREVEEDRRRRRVEALVNARRSASPVASRSETMRYV